MANRKEVANKIIELAAISYRKDIDTVEESTEFYSMSSNSLLMTGLVALIEEEYDVTMTLPEAGACQTVGELIDLVISRME